MSRPTTNLRLFVAAYPPIEIAKAMLNAVASDELPLHRLTPADQVHLTLQFIGDVASRDLEGTIESVQRAAAGIPAFRLTPQRLISLPERGPVRLIAAETDAPAPLMELHRRLAQRLARNPRRDAADRYRPHLTLLRYSRPMPGRAARVEQALDLPAFEVSVVRVMRSTLQPAGAQHHELDAATLVPEA